MICSTSSPTSPGTELAPRARGFRGRARSSRATSCGCSVRPGCSGLPYDEEYGGGGQPYEVYLQVLEELASAWAAVALAVSVHTMSCYPLAAFGTDEQRGRWLPDMVGGELLGAYCLSEAQSGSDAASLRTRARPRRTMHYVLDGTKAWVTHGGVADYYLTFCRTSDDASAGSRRCSCRPTPPASTRSRPNGRWGYGHRRPHRSCFDKRSVAADRLIGAEGDGLRIALSALDSGRLGIAAIATGLAQAALDAAVELGHTNASSSAEPIAEFQGVSFILADMATGIEAARSTYLAAARRRDAGLRFGPQASMAKLLATDTAMKVTIDAVQLFGGYGYTTEYPVERYMREAKVMQIFEGTNQIQRMVIGRHLTAKRAPR